MRKAPYLVMAAVAVLVFQCCSEKAYSAGYYPNWNPSYVNSNGEQVYCPIRQNWPQMPLEPCRTESDLQNELAALGQLSASSAVPAAQTASQDHGCYTVSSTNVVATRRSNIFVSAGTRRCW